MAMKRVWIQMPEEIYNAAEERRKKQYFPSFTEYVRSLIRRDLTSPDSEVQPVDVKALAKALASEEAE